MYQAVEIIVPLASFALAFGIVYVAVTAKHREKMAMIEAGMNPNEKKETKHSRIRNGLLFFMVPLGIFVGYLISEKYPVMRNQSLGLIFAFIFGGLALVISYFIERNIENNNQID